MYTSFSDFTLFIYKSIIFFNFRLVKNSQVPTSTMGDWVRRDLVVKDSSGEINLKLWGKYADTNLDIGTQYIFNNVEVSVYKTNPPEIQTTDPLTSIRESQNEITKTSTITGAWRNGPE